MLKLPNNNQAGVSALFLTLMSFTSVASADIVKIDGSSTVFPITEAVAEDFQKERGAPLELQSAFQVQVVGSRNFAVAKSILSTHRAPFLKMKWMPAKQPASSM